jgi:hypothetical protein
LNIQQIGFLHCVHDNKLLIEIKAVVRAGTATVPEHMSSTLFCGVHVAQPLVFCVIFIDRCLFLFPFLLAIVLSVLVLLAIVLPVLVLLAIVLPVLVLLAIVLPVLVLLAIVLPVLVRFAATDYPFGIFNFSLSDRMFLGRTFSRGCYKAKIEWIFVYFRFRCVASRICVHREGLLIISI